MMLLDLMARTGHHYMLDKERKVAKKKKKETEDALAAFGDDDNNTDEKKSDEPMAATATIDDIDGKTQRNESKYDEPVAPTTMNDDDDKKKSPKPSESAPVAKSDRRRVIRDDDEDGDGEKKTDSTTNGDTMGTTDDDAKHLPSNSARRLFEDKDGDTNSKTNENGDDKTETKPVDDTKYPIDGEQQQTNDGDDSEEKKEEFKSNLPALPDDVEEDEGLGTISNAKRKPNSAPKKKKKGKKGAVGGEGKESHDIVVSRDKGDGPQQFIRREIELDFKHFVMKYAHAAVLLRYSDLLAQYRNNSRETNKFILQFFERIAGEHGCAPMFYQVVITSVICARFHPSPRLSCLELSQHCFW
jgi:hypothetical protein